MAVEVVAVRHVWVLAPNHVRVVQNQRNVTAVLHPVKIHARIHQLLQDVQDAEIAVIKLVPKPVTIHAEQVVLSLARGLAILHVVVGATHRA